MKKCKKIFQAILVLGVSLLTVGGLLFNSSQTTQAASLPNSPRTFYYDELGKLDDTTKDLVTNKNEGYKKTKKEPQVVVAVVKSTNGDDIDSYAPDLFEKWQIGQKGEDNGVLILYAENGNNHNIRIEVGYGLEGAITDAQAGQILTANRENLKSSDWTKINKGLQASFNAVTTLVDKEYGYKGDKNTLSDSEMRAIEKPRSFDSLWSLALAVIVIGVAYIFSRKNRNGRGGPRGGSGLPWWIFMGSGFGGGSDRDDDDDHWGGFGSGGGGFGGGGGFSGGGGGSGGGGASI